MERLVKLSAGPNTGHNSGACWPKRNEKAHRAYETRFILKTCYEAYKRLGLLTEYGEWLSGFLLLLKDLIQLKLLLVAF